MKAVKAASIIFVAAFCLTAVPPQTDSRPASAEPVPGSSPETVLAQGWDALKGGRYEEAASRFRLVLARRSDASEALFGLGIACSQLGQLQEAREALERYVRLQPSAADGHSALGLVLLAAGQRTDAKVELERALRLEPQDLEAAKALAHIELQEYDNLSVVGLLKPLATSPDFDDQARRLLAAGYAQSGDHRAAVSILGPALDRQPPPPPEVFILITGSALRAGDTALAEHACDLGLRFYLNSDEIEQRCLRVVSMPFVDHLESTLVGSAKDVPTLILMGRLLAEIAGVSDEATKQRCIKVLEKAVVLSPADPVALYNLGRGLRMLVRPEQAIPVLERALGTHPNQELQTLIWTQIGLAEQDLGHVARAENAFGRAFQLNRRLARHLVASAFILYTFLMAETKERQAAAVLDELLHWDPSFLPARMKHAQMLAEEGRLAEAAEEAELVARNADEENQPLNRAAHIFLLQLYKRMGRTEEAARHEAWLKKSRTAPQP
ncbi:MAG: tetratricopeptide repeat protein [Bryobacteraceae bacterium]